MANVWNGSVWVDEATGNTYDPAEGVWRDPATGNYQDAQGVWTNAQGQKFINGQWVSQGTASASTGGSAYGVVPGYQWIVDQQNRDFEAAQSQINREFTAAQNDLNRSQQSLMAETERKLQLELQAGNLDAQKYLQQRELAQRESEFARDLALRTLEADRQNKLQRAQLQINQAAEIRQERLLQSQLAANPQDLVAYEFYKRNLGTPEAWNLAQQWSQQGGTANPTGMAAQSGGPLGNEQIDSTGESYPDAPPAYSDETLQQLAAGLYGGSGKSLYNPGLSGTGVFGAQIESPGAISRSEGLALTDQELGILSSFLRGGIDMGNGRRTSIDPSDYFQQAERGWIPTVSSIGGVTQYS